MGIERKYKDPNETISFGVDWSEYLGVATINTSTWILPAGITQVAATNTTNKTTIMLSGGTLGITYRITNRINSSAGEILDQSIDIEIIEK